MSEASSPTPGQRFAQDLHRIRKAQGVSLEDLHEETKIPLGLLGQFEASGLFDHPMFNRVYLRSLVRTYARKVGLPIPLALDMLDRALEGKYAGELAAEYFDEPPPPPADASTGEAASEADPAAEEAPAATDAASTGAPPQDEPEPEPSTASGKPGAPPEAAPVTPPLARTVSERPAPGEPKPPPASVTTPEREGRRQWLIGGGILVGLVLLIVLIVVLTGDDGSPPTPDDTRTVGDTTLTAEHDTASLAAPPLAGAERTVGDTIDVLVVAADAPIRGIRITRDNDVRRPYWIEQGNALATPVRQRIAIERGLDAIQLFVEGYAYPISQRDPQGRLVITRSDVEAFVDTLTGPTTAPRVAADTIPMPPAP